MPKRHRPTPPNGNRNTKPRKPLGILELDRFTEASLNRWNAVSKDLDELQAVLYFGIQPEQRRLRVELIGALQRSALTSLDVSRWVRFVTYQYSLEPLSCAGSLQQIGGRFNAGAELDRGTLNPWPALYLAEDYETAFREKFQLAQAELVEGLNPQELALGQGVSHTAVFVRGRLHRVFDMTTPQSLDAVAQVFRRVKLPQRARQLQKQLLISNSGVTMIQTGQQLYDAVLKHNWRTLPVQFGLPTQSHTLAELIRAAGFEAILYRSTKGPGQCLAVFPDLLNSASFVELVDTPPSGVQYRRLDGDSADALAGWDALPPQLRPR